MKVVLDDEHKSYINVDYNKEKEGVELSIKTNKDSLTSVMITVVLNEKQLDRLISAIVSTKPAFIKNL